MSVDKVVYRAVLRMARQFDKNVTAKALIQRHGLVRPPSNDRDAIGGDRRLYAAALEVVVGSHCHVRPERLDWSLQRLVRTIRLADQNNLEAIADRIADNEGKGVDGLPKEDRQLWEQHSMAATALDIFFPGELAGVKGADKVSAGLAAIRELSSKWALAVSLGLTEGRGREEKQYRSSSSINVNASSVKRRRRRLLGPRNTTTKRAIRARRHQDRHFRRNTATHEETTSLLKGQGLGLGPQKSLMGPRVAVEPTDTPAKGVYLISHPLSYIHAPEEVFHRSVVLLVHHDESSQESEGGSYGLIVNKGKGQTLEEVLCGDALPVATSVLGRLLKNPVRVGGPMMPRLAWLHGHKEVGGVPLAGDDEKPVFFCGTMEKAVQLLNEGVADAADFSLVVGASSWKSGQLRGELDHGLWIMAKAPASFALTGGENLWRELLEAMGGPYAAMSRVPRGQHWEAVGAKNSPSDWL